jgi:hypothetical protein
VHSRNQVQTDTVQTTGRNHAGCRNPRPAQTRMPRPRRRPRQDQRTSGPAAARRPRRPVTRVPQCSDVGRFQTRREAVPDTSGAELDRVAGINNYGRASPYAMARLRWHPQPPPRSSRLRVRTVGSGALWEATDRYVLRGSRTARMTLLVILTHPHQNARSSRSRTASRTPRWNGRPRPGEAVASVAARLSKARPEGKSGARPARRLLSGSQRDQEGQVERGMPARRWRRLQPAISAASPPPVASAEGATVADLMAATGLSRSREYRLAGHTAAGRGGPDHLRPPASQPQQFMTVSNRVRPRPRPRLARVCTSLAWTPGRGQRPHIPPAATQGNQ